MRQVKRSEAPDSIDSADSATAKSRAPGRLSTIAIAAGLAAVLGGSAYYFAEQLLALWSPTTDVTTTVRQILGGGVAVLVLALSVLLPAAAKARRDRRGAPEEVVEELPAVVLGDESVAQESADGGDSEPSGPSPEEMMLSLESELSAAAAELAAELERAANEAAVGDPYGADATELDLSGEEQRGTVIVAADPPQALTAIAIPVWVDDVAEREFAQAELAEGESADASDQVDPVHLDPLGAPDHDARSGHSPVAESASLHEAPVDETPDADGNTNPTVRVLQAQIRSLEEALFRQAAAESHPPEPQPELPRAASKDEVTREVLARVRHTIRGLGVRMDGDPVAADVISRVEAAVERLAETGFFVRPTLSEPAAEDFAPSEVAMAPTDQFLVESAYPLPDPQVPDPQLPDPRVSTAAENWSAPDVFVASPGADGEVAGELTGEVTGPRTATAVIDDRPLAERLATEAVLAEPEVPEPTTDQADVVLPVPAGPPAPTAPRSRRWRRGTPAA